MVVWGKLLFGLYIDIDRHVLYIYIVIITIDFVSPSPLEVLMCMLFTQGKPTSCNSNSIPLDNLVDP